MMNKKDIKGLTLIEILIGVAITALMMGAMFASYSVVNNSYNQVTDKAKVSRSSRDIVGMIIRDIRLAGFKYYYGANDEGIEQFHDLEHISGSESDRTVNDSHDPIIVFKDTLGYSTADNTDTTVGTITKHQNHPDQCCDQIRIVYGDFVKADDQKYKKYRLTYYALPMSKNENDKYYGIYKAKESWVKNDEYERGAWISTCAECYKDQLVRSHLVDMEFLLFDENGKHLFNTQTLTYPRPDNISSVDLYRIARIDLRLSFRSKKNFYRTIGTDDKPRLVLGLGSDKAAAQYKDKFLRDSTVSSVTVRNIGIE